jgi:hypothetical protein
MEQEYIKTFEQFVNEKLTYDDTNLNKHDRRLNNFIKNKNELEIGTEYALVDLGMGQWLAGYVYDGIKKGEHYFKSNLQFDDDIAYYTDAELKDSIKKNEIATVINF